MIFFFLNFVLKQFSFDLKKCSGKVLHFNEYMYKLYLQARAKQREFEIDTLHDAMFG